MKTSFRICLIMIILCSTSACASLSVGERVQLLEMHNCGIDPQEQGTKHPVLAGALNILPGFGNFYLAYGADGNQWTVGGLNLLFWPYSVLWGIPEAAIDAGNINRRMTLEYYTYTAFGKKALDDRCQDMGYPKPLAR